MIQKLIDIFDKSLHTARRWLWYALCIYLIYLAADWISAVQSACKQSVVKYYQSEEAAK